MARQYQDVLCALAQGRQLDGEMHQSVVQVFTKPPGADQSQQIPMRRGDNAHIDFVGVIGAQRANLTLL
ncbi:hypothetical protein D3C87_2059100 [compost metagenome]